MSTSASVGSGFQATQFGPNRVDGEDEFTVGLSFYFPSGYAMTGTERPSESLIVNPVAASDRRAVLDLAYAAGDKWWLQFSLPLRSLEVENPKVDYTRFMDPEVRVARVILPEPLVTATVGVFLPLAQTEVRGGGVRLTDPLQPGRGVYGMRLACSCVGEIVPSLSAFASGGVRRDFGDNDYGYRYGQALDASLGVAASYHTVSLLLGASAVRTSADEVQGVTVRDTGGTVYYVAPGIRFEPAQGMALIALDQIAVRSDVEGQQMLPRHTLMIGLSMFF